METLTLSRPAKMDKNTMERLDAECRSARWIHHRLLDFEDQHQRVLDEAAEAAAPGIVRAGRILAKLARRARRAERSTSGTWCPNPHPELAARLKAKVAELRKARDADPRWKAAIGWADEPVGEAKEPRRRRAKPANKVKRRKTETEEAFAKRFALLTTDETDEHFAAKLAAAPRRTRREQYRADLYAQRRIYHGTWNALVRSVDQARRDVLKRRKQGLPAEWRRPKFRDPVALAAANGGFRIVERGVGARWLRNDDGRTMRQVDGDGPWWIIEMRVGVADEWVRFRAKCGNWHDVPESASITMVKLIRRQDGERWSYSVSLTIDGAEKDGTLEPASSGVVAFDWGHREHGHDSHRSGIRAFVWIGDDGATGEVLIPAECRELLDEIDALKSHVDTTFDARRAAHRLEDRNRYTYRRRLMRTGVRTQEESAWLRWEMRYERRIMTRRERIQDLRREVYLATVRQLRTRYSTFAFEDEAGWSLRKQQGDDQMRRRQRSNRDLATRYEFVEICERFGAQVIAVAARNSTRECPEPGCGGLLAENGPELIVVCPKCGTARDKDDGARRVILRRALEVLANEAA